MKIEIDTKIERLNIDYIYEFIVHSYWGKDRSREIMETCISHSLNFGVYLDNRQIGYARLVTDYGQFAYLMDLFIDEQQRGKGFSKELMKYILNYEPLKTIHVWRLSTTDAHSLYEQFGFKHIESPENSMILKRT